MCAGVGGTHQVLTHVPEASFVAFTPRFVACHAETSWRAIRQNLEGRVARPQRHARESRARQRVDGALPNEADCREDRVHGALISSSCSAAILILSGVNGMS